jgi:GntR family transcriptional regulator
MVAISRASSVPLHLQIRRALQEEISSGTLPPGARLPSEAEFADAFKVSIAPVRQALLDLAAAGLITRHKGRGTFVRDTPVEEEIDLLTSFTASLRRRGVPVRMQVLDHQALAAPVDVSRALGLRPGARVVRLRRLAWISDEPAAVVDAWLPAPAFRRLLDYDDFDTGRSLYATLETDFGVQLGMARSRLEVARASEDEARLLNLSESTPILRVASITEDTVGRVVEAAWVTYRADRFAFTLISSGGRRDGTPVETAS